MFGHWEDCYSIGNDMVDAEHRLLLWNCRKVHQAVRDDESAAAIGGAVAELRALAQYHFLSEENLMKETRCPDLGIHSEQHFRLLHAFDRVCEKVLSREVNELAVMRFFHEWLVGHILTADQKLGDYLRVAEHRPIGEKLYPHFLLRSSPGV